MKKSYKIGLIIILLVIVIISAIGIGKIFIKPKKDEEKNQNVTSIISNIKDFGYTLDDRDTKYMKETFEELETVLNKEEIEYEEYAKLISKLFIIDFYTLNNKINKYDVGGLEYILNEKVEMFKTKAMDTIYSDIIDNTYKNRIQELPEITEVNIINLEEAEVTINENDIAGYKIEMEYTYKEDLGYDKEGTIYLVKNANKLEIAIYNPTIEKIEE